MYAIKDAPDEAAALNALVAEAPANVGALLLDDTSYNVEPLGRDLWIGTVDYKTLPKRKPPQPGEAALVSFSTRGATQKITQGIARVADYPGSGVSVAPNFGAAINVTDDTVEGVEIVIPNLGFELRVVMDEEDVDNTYIGKLYELTGKVNDDNFRGLSAGECLFLGAQGDNQRGDGKFDLSFAFACSKNISGATVGGITGVTKKGWDYIWFRYTKQVDGTANPKVPVMRATSAHVVQVYQSADFDELGLPS